MDKLNEKIANDQLEKGYKNAEELLKDNDKMEIFLQKLENKLKVIPKAGNTLAMIPMMISLIKSYIKKEYTNIPIGSIIALISALSYWLAPVDLIPDVIPIVGQIDDAAVIVACIKLIGSDLDEYQKWRQENNKLLGGQNE